MKGKIMKRNMWVGIVGLALLFWSASAQARPPQDGKGAKKSNVSENLGISRQGALDCFRLRFPNVSAKSRHL